MDWDKSTNKVSKGVFFKCEVLNQTLEESDDTKKSSESSSVKGEIERESQITTLPIIDDSHNNND